MAGHISTLLPSNCELPPVANWPLKQSLAAKAWPHKAGHSQQISQAKRYPD